MESVFKFWKNMERKTREMLPMQVFPAQVKKVAEEERTCTVRVNDNVDFFDVKLYAVTDKSLKGFCLIPAIDSTVLVARIANGNDLYVCSFSEVDKVLGTIGDKVEFCLEEDSCSFTGKGEDDTEVVALKISKGKVTVDAKEIVFNNGENDSLININTLTAKINELVKTFNGHTHQIPSFAGTLDGTTVTAGEVPLSAPTSKANNLDKKDYEDTKVKH